MRLLPSKTDPLFERDFWTRGQSHQCSLHHFTAADIVEPSRMLSLAQGEIILGCEPCVELKVISLREVTCKTCWQLPQS